MQKRADIEVLTDALKSLNGMRDASSQMVHHRLNPKWIAFRDYLNIVEKRIQNIAKDFGL